MGKLNTVKAVMMGMEREVVAPVPVRSKKVSSARQRQTVAVHVLQSVEIIF